MAVEQKAAWRGLGAPAMLLGAATLVLHLVVNNRYGVFSDELYFIVCGQHPAPGYVDQPALIPLIAAASHALFGTALLPLRLVPALAMTATVALTCELARMLGGGRYAQWLAGLCVLFGGVFLVDGMLLTTDCLQPLTWLGCGVCLVRLSQTRDERWWLGFGAFAGVALASKFLIGFYLVGLAAGVLATPLRRSLASPWLYAGAAIALVIAAPGVVWQAAHGWPFLELGEAGASAKNLVLSPLGFLGQQLLFVGPLAAPVWLAGLWAWSVRPPAPELRAFPIAYLVMAALFYALHGKAYYLAPVYPVLLAGGASAIEGWLARPIWRGLILAATVAAGVAFAPLALPILSPAQYGGYASAIGLSARTSQTEKGNQGVLPLHLAGQIGWREMAAQVAAVYRALPPDERARAVFFGRDYGEAAAIDVYGRALGGPPAISGHNAYFLWGPGSHDGSVVITAGADFNPLIGAYRSVQVAGHIDTPYAEPFETNIPVYVLRQPRQPLAALWPSLKHYW